MRFDLLMRFTGEKGKGAAASFKRVSFAVGMHSRKKNCGEILVNGNLQGTPLVFNVLLRHPGCGNLMEKSSREKKPKLKPYPVGYGGGARQMIWFRGEEKRESGFGLEGRIKNLRGLSLG